MIVIFALAALHPAFPPVPREVERFNYVIGTQTIGPKYRFTRDTVLVETAKAILAMGSNVLKISLEKDYAKQYPGLAANPKISSLVELARDEPSFRAVLRMPFRHLILWAYPFDVGWWADGLSADESEKAYRQIYDLAAHLLRTYSGTGKTFYLGHWEGDWHLHPTYDPAKDPTDIMIRGMVDWFNVRQRAIEDARRDTRHRSVEVYGYAEVNLVQKAMKGGMTLTNDVLPRTNVDFVSYSSYDSLTAEPSSISERLKAALSYVESKLPAKPGIAGKRVFIGEYGFPKQHHTPERQEELSRAVCRAALEWGCRFALYWEMYCNENPDGKHRGFWLIDDHGEKQPVYHMHERFYREARERVAEFRRTHRRLPTAEEFGRIGSALLR